jgi:hypothetical protein
LAFFCGFFFFFFFFFFFLGSDLGFLVVVA